MKLDANSEVRNAGSLSYTFSRVVGSLFVGIAYNFTASLIHRGPRDKFSSMCQSSFHLLKFNSFVSVNRQFGSETKVLYLVYDFYEYGFFLASQLFTDFSTIFDILAYLIASLNLGSGELIYFAKAAIIFLSCSLFIEATAFFDSYIQGIIGSVNLFIPVQFY